MFNWFGERKETILESIKRSVFQDSRKRKPKSLDHYLAMSFHKTAADFAIKPNMFATDSAEELNFNSTKQAWAANRSNLPEAQLAFFCNNGFIGFQMCAILAQHWLIDKACTVPARDASRNGFNITVNDGKEAKPEVLDKLRQLDKKYALNSNLVEFVRNGRIFGIRIMIFVVEGQNYSVPFNIESVKKGQYIGMSQVDPQWCIPELDTSTISNPADLNFYEPTWWTIGGIRYHKSHLAVFRPCPVTDLLKPTYQFAGVSIPQKIVNRVYGAERTANESPLLAMTKRMTVLKTDTAQAMASEGEFEQKMEYWVALMNNFAVKVIDEGDEITQHDTNLTGLDDITMTQFQLVAAGAEMPATKLLETSPKGFQSSGGGEMKSYHEGLESIQTHDLTPIVERHHALLIRSEQLGDFTTSIEWHPIATQNAIEEADIRNKDSQTAKNYSDMGAIDGHDVRQKLIADPKSGFTGMNPEMEEPEEEEPLELTDLTLPADEENPNG